MRKVILFLSLLMVSSIALGFSTKWSCATSHHLTTSYAMIDEGDYYELQVLHHNGLDFMPIHRGLITISDLDILKGDSQIFRKLGKRYVIRFQKSQCKIDDNEWGCLILDPVKIGDLEVDGVGFKLYKQQIITKTSNYTSNVLAMDIEVGDINYRLPMEYAANNCVFY